MLVSLILAVEAISLSHTSARNLSSFATVHMATTLDVLKIQLMTWELFTLH